MTLSGRAARAAPALVCTVLLVALFTQQAGMALAAGNQSAASLSSSVEDTLFGYRACCILEPGSGEASFTIYNAGHPRGTVSLTAAVLSRRYRLCSRYWANMEALRQNETDAMVSGGLFLTAAVCVALCGILVLGVAVGPAVLTGVFLAAAGSVGVAYFMNGAWRAASACDRIYRELAGFS